jgi:transposase
MNPLERREMMRPKATQNPESVVKEIKRNTRRKFNSEEKIRIILEGLRGEDSIGNICRKEWIAPSNLLQVEQGVFGGVQTAVEWRHNSGGQQ